jgi:hypothetical protein
MLQALNNKPMKLLAVIWLVLLAGVLVTVVAAQDGEFHRDEWDPKLNVDVLDPEGGELLFVPEEAIVAGVAAMEATGQYQLLGMGERAWYGGAPVAIYILPNGEFQLNAADDWGKPVEFQWRECRNVTLDTSDGCIPGWDRDATGTCVFDNLY